MKSLSQYDDYRIPHPLVLATTGVKDYGDAENGFFRMNILGREFYICASTDGVWEHLSISPCKGKKVANYEELCYIKRKFFNEDEVAVHYFVDGENKVNICDSCLHLWRNKSMPLPPKEYV